MSEKIEHFPRQNINQPVMEANQPVMEIIQPSEFIDPTNNPYYYVTYIKWLGITSKIYLSNNNICVIAPHLDNHTQECNIIRFTKNDSQYDVYLKEGHPPFISIIQYKTYLRLKITDVMFWRPYVYKSQTFELLSGWMAKFDQLYREFNNIGCKASYSLISKRRPTTKKYRRYTGTIDSDTYIL